MRSGGTLMVWNLTSMLFCSLLKVELSLAAHSSLSRRQTRRTVEFSLKVMYSRILMRSSAGSSTRASWRWPGPPRPPGHRVWGAGVRQAGRQGQEVGGEGGQGQEGQGQGS